MENYSDRNRWELEFIGGRMMIKKINQAFFKDFKTIDELVIYCIENDIDYLEYEGQKHSVMRLEDLWATHKEKSFIENNYVPKHILPEEY